jgi:beta-galactosidase
MTRLIERDRNHPCVVIWSIGNEEWSIESNEKGTRIAQTMQRLARPWTRRGASPPPSAAAGAGHLRQH